MSTPITSSMMISAASLAHLQMRSSGLSPTGGVRWPAGMPSAASGIVMLTSAAERGAYLGPCLDQVAAAPPRPVVPAPRPRLGDLGRLIAPGAGHGVARVDQPLHRSGLLLLHRLLVPLRGALRGLAQLGLQLGRE